MCIHILSLNVQFLILNINDNNILAFINIKHFFVVSYIIIFLRMCRDLM